jgi:hypothetical protein
MAIVERHTYTDRETKNYRSIILFRNDLDPNHLHPKQHREWKHNSDVDDRQVPDHYSNHMGCV